jgi:hypothetical protein
LQINGEFRGKCIVSGWSNFDPHLLLSVTAGCSCCHLRALVIQERSNNGSGQLREATHGDRIGIAVGAFRSNQAFWLSAGITDSNF